VFVEEDETAGIDRVGSTLEHNHGGDATTSIGKTDIFVEKLSQRNGHHAKPRLNGLLKEKHLQASEKLAGNSQYEYLPKLKASEMIDVSSNVEMVEQTLMVDRNVELSDDNKDQVDHDDYSIQEINQDENELFDDSAVTMRRLDVLEANPEREVNTFIIDNIVFTGNDTIHVESLISRRNGQLVEDTLEDTRNEITSLDDTLTTNNSEKSQLHEIDYIVSDSTSVDYNASKDLAENSKTSRIRRLLSLLKHGRRITSIDDAACSVEDEMGIKDWKGESWFRSWTRPVRQTLASFRYRTKGSTSSSRNPWGRRHARNVEEGIRHEKAQQRKRRKQATTKLSTLLNRAKFNSRGQVGRRYLERILMGLLFALAEESEDLDVSINSQRNSPVWRKEVDEFRINFSRLGFKPLRLGGTWESQKEGDTELAPLIECADEAFDLIDVDNSGSLDNEEIAQALSMISSFETDKDSIEELANELVDLYDANGDGVVDREEYHLMVEDMEALQKERAEAQKATEASQSGKAVSARALFFGLKSSLENISDGITTKVVEATADASNLAGSVLGSKNKDIVAANNSVPEKVVGSLVLSDLKLDLRRLVFGSIPIVKHITPGGHLVLEPFTATLKGSFNRDDVMKSGLLDAGLRLLVARALRVRVRSFRDLVDGAVFFGRRWKMTSKTAPVVDVLDLSNVEFDKRDRMILTGRARIRASPDAPVVTNTFKVRTKIGTRNRGQAIRLVEPELAFVFECPKSLEQLVELGCEQIGVPPPSKPEPIYSFFPIYSPFKLNDNAGFDMGEDNRLRSIYIKNGALHFEMRAVLRPGRFLGNHYIAFTIPNRTFIITLDRVLEGIRAARRNKKMIRNQEAEKERLVERSVEEPTVKSLSAKQMRSFYLKTVVRVRRLFTPSSARRNRVQPKSFFTRFVEGYTLVERDGEDINEQLTIAISDWFGRQRRRNRPLSSEGAIQKV
jgi:hypothetical protein